MVPRMFESLELDCTWFIEESKFSFRYVRLCDFDIPKEQWLNYLHTVKALNRRRILRPLILVCTVYMFQLPVWGSPYKNGLNTFSYMYVMKIKFNIGIKITFLYCLKLRFCTTIYVFMPPPFSMGWRGGGGAYSITAVRTYVRPVRPVPSVPYITLLVSVRYLLKGLVYWIEILYTGI